MGKSNVKDRTAETILAGMVAADIEGMDQLLNDVGVSVADASTSKEELLDTVVAPLQRCFGKEPPPRVLLGVDILVACKRCRYFLFSMRLPPRAATF